MKNICLLSVIFVLLVSLLSARGAELVRAMPDRDLDPRSLREARAQTLDEVGAYMRGHRHGFARGVAAAMLALDLFDAAEPDQLEPLQRRVIAGLGVPDLRADWYFEGWLTTATVPSEVQQEASEEDVLDQVGTEEEQAEGAGEEPAVADEDAPADP